MCESPCQQLSTCHLTHSHSKVPEGSATCPRSHCQPRAQPGCLSPGQAAPGPCPPPKLPLSLPAAHRRGSCWILGLHAPLPLSALSFLFRPSAPGPRNPSLDWGRTPCPGAAGRSSRSGALLGGGPPDTKTVPLCSPGARSHRSHRALFPLYPEPSQRPMGLSGGVRTSLSTPLPH